MLKIVKTMNGLKSIQHFSFFYSSFDTKKECWQNCKNVNVIDRPHLYHVKLNEQTNQPNQIKLDERARKNLDFTDTLR